ncbi:MAG: NAD-dependent epimerase/dehydratase family protein, partial [Planctomycetota bacterium]
MRALVTGGGGFLGGAIVSQLVKRGDDVVSFSRGRYPELEGLGVTTLVGDLADARSVARAVKGCDVVFHVAAKAGIWGSYRHYYQTNVLGTENVLAACCQQGRPPLIYTSTPSVVYAGRDQEGVDETAPYPEKFLAHYPRTKAMAERRVLAAGREGLATVSLRPHLMWGPRDHHLVPRLISRARAGKLRLIGTRPNKVDSIYVENAAEAHLLAADCLARNPSISGRSYFISQGEPLPLAELINRILEAAELPPVTQRIPASVAYGTGWLLECLYKAFAVESEPPMTRFLARQLSTAHWFDIGAARRDLGYQPRISL